MPAKKFQSTPDTLRHSHPVRYQWPLADGTICHGHTVLCSATRAGLRQAIRRFWITNNHVTPSTANNH